VIRRPGDWIGPEILPAAASLLGAVAAPLEYEKHLFGCASIDQYFIALKTVAPSA
jgi:isocitrate/isopropylmalate dehydrogenase